MAALTAARIRDAIARSPWDLTNTVLYDLCQVHPDHTDTDAILAKVLLIGRSYAASIERRPKKDAEDENDGFYLRKVAPQIKESHIDSWLTQARLARPGSLAALSILVEVHGRTTQLFRRISGRENRSLASKYLHFHVPTLFYIYDSRAVEAMRKFVPRLGGAAVVVEGGDYEYRRFAGRCFQLAKLCADEFSLNLTPRQLDNLLTGVNE